MEKDDIRQIAKIIGELPAVSFIKNFTGKEEFNESLEVYPFEWPSFYILNKSFLRPDKPNSKLENNEVDLKTCLSNIIKNLILINLAPRKDEELKYLFDDQNLKRFVFDLIFAFNLFSLSMRDMTALYLITLKELYYTVDPKKIRRNNFIYLYGQMVRSVREDQNLPNSFKQLFDENLGTIKELAQNHNDVGCVAQMIISSSELQMEGLREMLMELNLFNHSGSKDVVLGLIIPLKSRVFC